MPVQPGTLDRQGFDSGASVDQRLEQGFRAAFRKLEHPFVALAASLRRDGVAPAPVACPRAQPDDRAQARSCFVDPAVEGDLALGDDRDLLAEAFRVGDNVGREDDRDAGARLAADHLFQPRLVDRIEAAERLVQNQETRLVDRRPE